MRQHQAIRELSNVSLASTIKSPIIGYDNQSDTEWGNRSDYGITAFEVRLAAGLAFVLISMIVCACVCACKIVHGHGFGCSWGICRQGYEHVNTEGDEGPLTITHENTNNIDEEKLGIEMT